MKHLLILFSLILTLLLSSCGADVQNSDNSDKAVVYTSFNAMYQITKEIAGDKADVECLMPSGAEPHDWEPSAGDIVKLQKADIFVYSSDDMETWVSDVLNSAKSGLDVVEASKDITEIDVDVHENDDGHSHGGHDPHVWLDPKNAVIQAQSITDELCKTDSENADYYKQNLAVFKEKAENLDNEYKQVLQNAKTKYIIVSHEAYGYLCNAYGLEQIGIEGVMADSEPSPAKMAEIVNFAKEHNIRYVFAENSGDTKLADTAANEIGGEVLVLSPFESGSEDYFTVMENNLQALKKALCE